MWTANCRNPAVVTVMHRGFDTLPIETQIGIARITKVEPARLAIEVRIRTVHTGSLGAEPVGILAGSRAGESRARSTLVDRIGSATLTRRGVANP